MIVGVKRGTNILQSMVRLIKQEARSECHILFHHSSRIFNADQEHFPPPLNFVVFWERGPRCLWKLQKQKNGIFVTKRASWFKRCNYHSQCRTSLPGISPVHQHDPTLQLNSSRRTSSTRKHRNYSTPTFYFVRPCALVCNWISVMPLSSPQVVMCTARRNTLVKAGSPFSKPLPINGNDGVTEMNERWNSLKG